MAHWKAPHGAHRALHSAWASARLHHARPPQRPSAAAAAPPEHCSPCISSQRRNTGGRTGQAQWQGPTSVQPLSAAQWRAVQPSSSRALTSWPASSRELTAAVLPSLAAMCSLFALYAGTHATEVICHRCTATNLWQNGRALTEMPLCSSSAWLSELNTGPPGPLPTLLVPRASQLGHNVETRAVYRRLASAGDRSPSAFQAALGHSMHQCRPACMTFLASVGPDEACSGASKLT
jgi:hypothetical protein